MYTRPGFYIYPTHTSIPIQQFPNLLHFQLHFPNLSPIFLLVYLHESSPAVPSIPVVFQYSRVLVLYSSNTMHSIPVCYSSKPASNIPVIIPFVFQSRHLLFNSSLPLTVSLIPLFLFHTPMFHFPNFYPACFSASPSSIPVLIISVPVPCCAFFLFLGCPSFSITMRRI